MNPLNRKAIGARLGPYPGLNRAKSKAPNLNNAIIDILKERAKRTQANRISLSGREEELYISRQTAIESMERERAYESERNQERRLQERFDLMDRKKIAERMGKVFRLELDVKTAELVGKELSRLLPPHMLIELTADQLKQVLAKSEKLKRVIMKLKDNIKIQRIEMQEAAREVGQIVQQME